MTCDTCGHPIITFNQYENDQGKEAKYTHDTPGNLDSYRHQPLLDDDRNGWEAFLGFDTLYGKVEL